MWSRFQSTHPARGATQRQSTNGKEQYISIHAPREGCDSTGMAFLEGELEFQSTHPARGATYDAMMQRKAAEISIHAPREGCDCSRPNVG